MWQSKIRLTSRGEYEAMIFRIEDGEMILCRKGVKWFKTEKGAKNFCSKKLSALN